MVTGTILAMERAELSPIKQKSDSSLSGPSFTLLAGGTKRALEMNHKENQDVLSDAASPVQSVPTEVVTPNGKALRRKIAAGVKRCIAAPASDDDMNKSDEDLDPEVLASSPISLTRRLRAHFMDKYTFECEKRGLDTEAIQKRLDKARKSLSAVAKKHKSSSKAPNPTDERDFKKMANYLNAPKQRLRYSESISFAVNEGLLVVVNKANMDTLSRPICAAICAHEITHGKNEDVVYRMAYCDEFKAQGLIHEFESDLGLVLYRTQEVFADLEPAALNPHLARSFSELRAEDAQKRGSVALDGTHPAVGDWAVLDALMVQLHEKHQQEKERKERMAHLSKKFREFESQA
jgi:hypothetical protein